MRLDSGIVQVYHTPRPAFHRKRGYNTVMMKRLMILLALSLLLLGTACTSIFDLALTPTGRPAAATDTAQAQFNQPEVNLQSTLTPTIEWFPPTATPTPLPALPTFTPTPQMKPGVGALVVDEKIDSPGTWILGRSDNGSAAFGGGMLSLAIQTAKGSLYSLRAGKLPANAYIEITASPSLCRGADQYGLLFRARSELDYYRLVVTCDGQMRLERVVNATASVIQDWIYSSQIHPGAPFTSTLGVWMNKAEYRVFVNGIYQFSAKDPVWQDDGQVGVFARAAADPPLTVGFTDLKVYQLDETQIPSP